MSKQGEKEFLKEVQSAWERAQQQLRDLRAQVERHSVLAETGVQLNTASRERTDAYRALGEVVYGLAERGELKLPKAAEGPIARIRAANARVEAQKASITDLLIGDEAPRSSKSGLAKKGKKG